jgi:hypothetical protein
MAGLVLEAVVGVKGAWGQIFNMDKVVHSFKKSVFMSGRKQ